MGYVHFTFLGLSCYTFMQGLVAILDARHDMCEMYASDITN